MGNRRLHHLSGWDIAKKIGCHYSGDMNTIDHGGLFYKLDDVEHGYIPCVEFSEADGMRFYQTGSINIPDLSWEDACKLVRDCLAQFSEDERESLMEQPTFSHVLTEYLRFQYGIEHDCFEWFLTPEDLDDLADKNRPRVNDGRAPVVLTENQALNTALRAL